MKKTVFVKHMKHEGTAQTFAGLVKVTLNNEFSAVAPYLHNDEGYDHHEHWHRVEAIVESKVESYFDEREEPSVINAIQVAEEVVERELMKLAGIPIDATPLDLETQILARGFIRAPQPKSQL